MQYNILWVHYRPTDDLLGIYLLRGVLDSGLPSFCVLNGLVWWILHGNDHYLQHNLEGMLAMDGSTLLSKWSRWYVHMIFLGHATSSTTKLFGNNWPISVPSIVIALCEFGIGTKDAFQKASVLYKMEHLKHKHPPSSMLGMCWKTYFNG